MSWICSKLTKPCLMCFAQACTFCSLSGFAPSVHKSIFGVKICTKTYPKWHPPTYGSAFQALHTRGAKPNLSLTFSLSLTRAADFPLKRSGSTTFRLQEELPDGRSSGERKERCIRAEL